MPSKNKRIYLTPTPEFRAWLERKRFLRADTSLAETFVSLAEDAIRAAGYDGPIMTERGKYARHSVTSELGSDERDPDESILFDDDHPNGIW